MKSSMGPRVIARLSVVLSLISAWVFPSPAYARMGGTVANGYEFSVIIRPGVGLLGTGSNSYSNTLGIGATTQKYNTYQLISSSPDWSYVDAGMYYCLALKTDSTLWGWGRGSGFVFGNNSEANLWLPAQIGTQRWIKVVAGVQTPGGPYTTSSFGIRSDSTLWAWGTNSQGQLGDGSTTMRSTPVQIGAAKWVDVHMNKYFTLGIQADSTLWGWGYNQFSVLGNPSIGNPTAPTKIGTDKWLQVCTGGAWSHGIKADSTLWGWGAHGGNGQTGLGSTSGEQTTPAQMGSGKWLRVVAGGNGSLGMKSDSTLWRWGTSPGGASNASTPTQIGSSKWRDFDIGFTGAVGIDASGNVYGWGTGSGEVGDGSYTQRSGPTAVTAFKAEQTAPTFPALADKIAGDAGYAPSATSVTGLPITFASSNNAIATTSPDLIYPVGAGTVDIIAIAPENATHYSSYSLRPLNVARGPQTLTFSAMADRTILDADFSPATSSSGLTVAYASSNTAVAEIVNGKIHLLASGSATITASQAGNSDYFPATDVVRTLTVINPPNHPHQDRKLSGSDGASFAIPDFGGLYGTGKNSGYLLGVGDQTDRNRLTLIASGTWRHVAAGGTYALALKADSTLWGWGTQPFGFGDGQTVHAAPAQIGTSRWITVSAGLSTYANLGIQADSSLWAWGDNDESIHGDGTTTDKTLPERIGTGKWLDIAQSSTHTVGLKSDYSLWTWGSGSNGQLGNGTTSGTVTTPAKIGAERWLRVAAGNGTAFAIRTDSTLWAWGSNAFGSTGSWSTWGSTNTPTQIGWGTKWIWVEAGNLATVGMKADSTLWTFGNNANGMIAQGSTNYTSNPSQVGTSKWRQAAQGMTGGLALRDSGVFYGWGLNTEGAVGDGSNTPRTTPVLARFIRAQTVNFPAIPAKTVGGADFSPGATATSGLPVTYASSNSSVAIILNGMIHIVGPGSATITASQPGDDEFQAAADTAQSFTVAKTAQTIAFASLPSRTWLQADIDPSATATSGLAVTYTSSDNAVATIVSGQIHLVGAGAATITASQAGDGTYDPAPDVTRTLAVANPPHPHKDRKVAAGGAASFIIVDGVGLYAAGYPNGYRLGTGDLDMRTRFHLIASGNWRQVEGGNSYGFALKADSTLWGWGTASAGFGDGAAEHATPVQIGSSRWITVTAGMYSDTHFGIQGDSTLWVWGANTSGIHGDGSSAAKSSPTRIGSAKWLEVSHFNSHVLAIKSDYTLWAWGTAVNGRLGNGASTGTVTAPVQIGSATWTALATASASSFGIRSDSTLWSWGSNNSGITGLGATSGNTTVPTKIGSSKWIWVEAGQPGVSGLRADSTLWTWGANGAGAIALGASGIVSSPAQVGSEKWLQAAIGSDHGLGRHASGDHYAWGLNSQGYVGDSTQTIRTTPVRPVFNRIQAFSFPAFAAKTFGDADFAPGASSNSGLAVGYASSNASVATIVSGQIHIVGAGTAAITASAGGNAAYDAGEATQTLTIDKAAQTLTFAPLADKRPGDGDYDPGATASSGLPVAYASSNSAVAAIVAGKIRIVGGGSTNITASQAGDGNFNAAADSVRTLTVTPSAQTISFSPLTAKTFGDGDFVPGATASSGLTVSYASSNNSVATILSGQIHIVGAGTTNITASQAGNADYAAAADAVQILTVNKVPQSIAFGALTAKTYGDSDFTPAASATSGLAVVFASSDTSVAVISFGKVHIVHPGTATITASQAGDSHWAAADAAQTLTVAKRPQIVAMPAFPAKYFDNDEFDPGATTNSGLAIAYASSNTAVARIMSGKVFITGVGTAIITAASAGNAYYLADDSSQTLTVGKASQKIVFEEPPDMLIGETDFTPIGNVNSRLPISYASSDTAVASIISGRLHAVGAGTTTITASQPGNANYLAAPTRVNALTVRKRPQTIAFAPLSARNFGEAALALEAVAGSGLAVAYTSSNLAVATVFGSVVTLVGTGITNITANQAGNPTWLAAPAVSQTLAVNKAAQSIAFAALTSKAIGDPAFVLTATAGSGLPVTYASSNPAVATVSGSTVTVVGAGTANITASQSGNGNFLAAADVVRTLAIVMANQTLSFPALSAKTFGDGDFAPGATATSGLSIAYASSDTMVAKIVSGQIRIVGAGTVLISASQAGDAYYTPAPAAARSLTVAKAAQSITFDSPAAKTFGDSAFVLAGSAGSGLSIAYSSSNGNVAIVSGSLVTIVGSGSTVIKASQSGNGNYDSAVSVARTFSVGKASQTINFSALPAKTFGDSSFAPVATARSGLPVSYVSSNPAVAAVSGSFLIVGGAGTAVITASQAGNGNFDSAVSVSQTITVGKAAQTIAFAALPPKSFGDADFNLTAIASSGLGIAYSSSDSTVATVTGAMVHIVGPGSAILTATQSGGPNHLAAPEAAQSLSIGFSAQTITFATLPSKTFGDTDFTPVATTSSGLPVAFASSNQAVATIASGRIHIVGAGTAAITASQAGNPFFDPATDVARTLTVAKAAQAISVTAIPAKTFGDPDFVLTATAGPGLTPAFAIADTLVAKAVAGKIHLMGGGVTAINWSQAGDSNYLAAADTVQTLTVGRAIQGLAFELGSDSLQTIGGAPFALVSVSTSGLSVAFSSSDPEVIAVSGTSASALKAGTAILTANQPGSLQYAPAAPINRSIRVRIAAPAPILAAELRPREETVIDTSVVLSWTSKPGAAVYRVIASVDTLQSATLADIEIRDTAFALGRLAFGSRIFWRVSALNSTGASAFSPFRSNLVRPLPPDPIDIAGIPAFPEAGVGTQVEISWPRMNGTTGYHIQVAADILLPPRIDTVVVNPALALADLSIGSTQYWRVAPVNGVSEAPFTPWLSFKVKDADDGAVTRTAVVQSATPEPVQVSALVGLVSKDSTMSDVKITLTEEKRAPANLPAGFAALTGKIELNAVSGADAVGDNQISITLTLPDTLLTGEKVQAGDEPMVYLVDSATGELTVLFDLKKDTVGRIILPLSQGKGFLLAVDNVPPVIADATPPEIRESGSSPVITGTVSDNIRNSRAWLRFRQGGDENFDSVAVTIDANGHFLMPLAIQLDGAGFEYNLAASDGRNRQTTPSLDLPVTLKALQAADSLPSLQWRLFALPTIANANQLSAMTATLGVYGQDWRLFERAPEGMKEFGSQLQQAEPGVAYWLKSRSSGFRPAILGGVAAPISKPFVIALPPRSWRSFGNPFLFPVSWQSVVDSSHAAPDALVGPYTFRDSSWLAPLEVPVLMPWDGYYAFNPSSDTVFLRIPSIRAKDHSSPLAKAAFHLRWQVRGMEGRDAGNVFGGLPLRDPGVRAGVAAKVSSAWNSGTQWNAAKPENPYDGVRAGFSTGEAGPGLLQTDFRDVSAQGGAMWTARLDGMKPGQRYSSRFLGMESLSSGYSVALADPATGSFVPWSADAVYTVEAQAGETARELRFFAGSPEYVESQGLAFAAVHPRAIELTNYPNPVRTYTILRFSVPVSGTAAPAQVRLSVFDMQGRCVTVIKNARMGAGRYTVRWDARDAKGGRVAAGMYRLLLEAGSKRMNRALHILN